MDQIEFASSSDEETMSEISIPMADIDGNVIEIEEEQLSPDFMRNYNRASEPEPNLPSKAQVNAMITQQIVDQAAKNAQKPGRELNAATAKKLEKQLKDQGPPDLDDRIRTARRLNDKRQVYAKKINFKFKPFYDASKLSLEQLKHEEYEVDTIINSQDVPTILKDGLKAVSGVMERLMTAFGFPLAKGFKKKMEINVDSNHFDQEFEQLAIDLKDYFARPPIERVLMKTGMIFMRTIEENQLEKITSVTPSLVEKAKGL